MASFIIENSEENFQHIVRLLNTNINGKRRITHGISQIKGIGKRFATVILKVARINTFKRAGELTAKEIQLIQDIIANPVGNGIPKWFLNRQKDHKDGTYSQLASNHLETKMREDLERMKKIRCHRGLRHYWGLKVRGQHTCTTGRRGATVGVAKKK